MFYRKAVLIIFESDPTIIHGGVLFGTVAGLPLLTLLQEQFLQSLKNFETAVS